MIFRRDQFRTESIFPTVNSPGSEFSRSVNFPTNLFSSRSIFARGNSLWTTSIHQRSTEIPLLRPPPTHSHKYRCESRTQNLSHRPEHTCIVPSPNPGSPGFPIWLPVPQRLSHTVPKRLRANSSPIHGSPPEMSWNPSTSSAQPRREPEKTTTDSTTLF